MDTKLDNYKNIIFFGAGKMAEYVYDQIDELRGRLVGCVDLLASEERKISIFKGVRVTSPETYSELMNKGDTAVVVCVFLLALPEIVETLSNKYKYPKQHIFLTNPYTSCRPCVINAEFGGDRRIPKNDKVYDEVRRLFKDDLSLDTYDMLRQSKTYDYLGDSYEIINYQEVKDLLWWSEDYWNTFEFKDDATKATVFDCGAYIGDSIESICRSIPHNEVYYHAFEPVDENADRIERADYSESCKEVNIHRVGVGYKTEDKEFIVLENHPDGGYISELDGNSIDAYTKETLKIVSLDDLNLEIHGRLFIKMDIEGAELDALMGGQQTIVKNRPYLAICVYHRKNDIINIPKYLDSILDNYHFFLRGGYHTILWGIPGELD